MGFVRKRFFHFFLFVFVAGACVAQNTEEVFPLEMLLDKKGKIFNVTPDKFMERMDQYFEWESESKETAKASSSVSFLGFKALDAIARFKNGKFSKFEIYLYNRDDERSRKTYFWGLLDKALSKPDEWTGVSGERVPHEREGKFAVLVKVWKQKPYLYTLKWACSHKDNKGFGERMRFEVSKLEDEDHSDKNKEPAKKPEVKKSTGALTDNIKKSPNGDVFIENIKTFVKGPCPSSVFEIVLSYYYGQDFDSSQIAQICKASEPNLNMSDIFKAFKSIDAKLRVRLKELYVSEMLKVDELDVNDMRVWSRACKVISKYNRSARKAGVPKIKIAQYMMKIDKKTLYYPKKMLAAMTLAGVKSMRLNGEKYEYKKFLKKVREYIKSGIPVCWCMTPALLQNDMFASQTSSRDLKLIIGYNDKENKIIYLDASGADHALNKMSYDDAWYITRAACVLLPRDRK
jgi:hypothetical protein